MVLTLLGHRLLGERAARGARIMAPAPAPSPDEAPTTPGHTPLWARHPAGPPPD